jgi:transposase
MFTLDRAARVWLVLGRTDMRKGVNGLSALVSGRLGFDPMDGSYYVFCGRKRDTVKILYYDKNGYATWYKKLETDQFRWPRTEAEARAVTVEQLGWLLSGLDLEQAHRPRRYSA